MLTVRHFISNFRLLLLQCDVARALYILVNGTAKEYSLSMIKVSSDLALQKISESGPGVAIYESDSKIEQYTGVVDFSNLEYLTIAQITKRRHRYTKRIPMFYFESLFNTPQESENEVSENLSYRSYAHLDNCGFKGDFYDYLKSLIATSEAAAQVLIKKSYRSPYLAIANGPEISPHVHLYNDRIDAVSNLSTVSICINLQSENARFLIYENVVYQNSKEFKDKYHNSLLPIKELQSAPRTTHHITKDFTIFVMNSTQTLHAVSEFQKGACLFFIYDKVELK